MGPHGSHPDPESDPLLTDRRAYPARRRPMEVTAGVVGLYVLNAVLAETSRDVMAVTVAGPLNVGFALALFLLAATIGATQWHARYARTAPVPLDGPMSSAVQQREPRR